MTWVNKKLTRLLLWVFLTSLLVPSTADKQAGRSPDKEVISLNQGICDSYCHEEGCSWTSKYTCPWQTMQVPGSANDDGSVGYKCCCVYRTSETQTCGNLPASNAPKGYCGVNVGGWLIMEDWMHGFGVKDEFEFSQQGSKVVRQHRSTFFTENDFEAIAKAGINSIRIPLGYWLLDIPNLRRHPYNARDGNELEPNKKDFIGPDEGYIDNALEWAQNHGLKVNLDLHGAPGQQSGAQTTGYENSGWQTYFWDMKMTVKCVEHMAVKWGNHPAVDMITVINEPSRDIDISILKEFYSTAYNAIRAHSSKVIVTFPLFLHNTDEFADFIAHARDSFHNYRFDIHPYYCFDDPPETLEEVLTRSLSGAGWPDLSSFGEDKHLVIISEWSLCTGGNYLDDFAQGSWDRRSAWLRHFGFNQISAFTDGTSGFFYWSWKLADKVMSDTNPWSLQRNLDVGWVSSSEWGYGGAEILQEETKSVKRLTL